MSLLLDAAVRVSLVVLAALVVASVLSRRSAAVRHWVLTVGLACAAATPLLQSSLPSWRVAPARLAADAPAGRAGPSVAASFTVRAPGQADGALRPESAAAARAGSRLGSVTALLLSAWLAGALVNLVLLAAALRRLSRVAAAARPVASGRLASIAAGIQDAFRMRRGVRLLQSRELAPPATWGALRPTLILPADAGDWPDDRVRIVLRHEFAHIARGDWAAQMLAETLRAALWFNPLLWIASRRLRRESERACDDVVIGSGIAPADYASHLLDLATRAGRRPARPALAMARPSSLEGRVRAMLSQSVNRRPLSRAARIGALVASVALTVPLAAAQGRFWSLSGTVVDPTERLVSDAVLTVSNESARTRFEVRTDREGRFEFQALPGGDYRLEVQKPGFKKLVQNLSIAGSDQRRTLKLDVGAVRESITIAAPRATAPPVDPGQAARRQQAVDDARKRASERCAEAPAGGAGGEIVPPMKLVDVRPDYPEAMRTAGIAGVVTLDTAITADGTVGDVTVVSSPHPDLARAAIEAVRQWQFTPTYLNCTPIEVDMRVTVSFGAVAK